MTSQKPKKFISILVVLTLLLSLLPATLASATGITREELIEGFVTRMYTKALNRQPDEEGFKFWVNGLLNGELTGAKVVEHILLKEPEFLARDLSNREFIIVLYNAFFDRDPESEEAINFWLDEMARGGTRKYVMYAMLLAPTNEFQTFCDYAGIEVGRISDFDDSERPAPKPVEPEKLEVVSVSATNLREVDIVFTKTVDKVTAENSDAYSVKQGVSSRAIESAKVLDDGKTVRLTLKKGVLFFNQVEAELAVTGVKDVAGAQVLTVSGLKFTPVDVVAPVIEKVESLGNKAIKIIFSEPVKMKSTVAGTFKIDDLVVSGIPTISGRTITIQLFNTLSSGGHVLSVNNQIDDYAEIQLVSTKVSFAVVPDSEPPVIVDVKNATLEGLTVVFSEDVQDAEATTPSNYYWMQGTAKKTATSVEKIDNKTFRVHFTTNNLPGYTTDLYVTKIKDYSGNVIASGTKIAVTASLDQTRPEVLTAIFDSENKDKMTLTFTKNIVASSFKASNVAVKKADGTVVSNGYTGTITGKVVVVKFTNPIKAAGTYTFEISGLTDTTLLKNAMLPYTTEFTVKDTNPPTASGEVTGKLPNFIITFSKAMDTTSTYSILNPANYYVTYNTATITGITGNLPAGTNLVPTSDNKGVIITFPAGVTAVTKLVVQGVKDVNGNFLKDYAKEYNIADFESDLVAKAAKATDTKTILVKMNQPVGNVVKESFEVTKSGAKVTVKNAEIYTSDNTLVKLTLDSAIPTDADGVKVKAVASDDTLGITGAKLAASNELEVRDAIAPTVIKNTSGKIEVGEPGKGIELSLDTTNNTPKITIVFTENIEAINNALLGENFKLYRTDGIPLTYGLDYTVSITGVDKNATIAIDRAKVDKLAGYDGEIRIVFDNSNGNIIDKTRHKDFNDTTVLKNKAAGFDTASALASNNKIPIDLVAPKIESFVAQDGKITLTFTEEIEEAATGALGGKVKVVEVKENGEEVGVQNVTVATDTNDRKKLVITSTELVSGKKYKVTVEEGAVKDLSVNTNLTEEIEVIVPPAAP